MKDVYIFVSICYHSVNITFRIFYIG